MHGTRASLHQIRSYCGGLRAEKNVILSPSDSRICAILTARRAVQYTAARAAIMSQEVLP